MSKSTILEEIIAHKLTEVSAAKQLRSMAKLEASLPVAGGARPFAISLQEQAGKKKAAVIAEVKKASPSKGLIREDFRPADHARDYQEHGATCISVLTDEKYFRGSNDYLVEARAACTIPVIRKDFMIDAYQIAESKFLGADCILLIVAALEQSQMKELASYSHEIDMDILVEVHNQDELERALEIDCKLIGINNRNLHSFETDLHTTLELAKLVPEDKTVITESGIHTPEDVQLMLENEIYGFLVGESFMRAEKPGQKLQELFFPS